MTRQPERKSAKMCIRDRYYYLKELRGYPIRIIGLDLKEDVICRCDTLAKSYGYDRLSFCCGDIASYEGVDRVDMVVTLHACDLATDYAMEKAVGWGAKVILSVPCCQHELNRQIENPLMKPVFGYGLILSLIHIWRFCREAAGRTWQKPGMSTTNRSQTTMRSFLRARDWAA